MKAIHNLVVFYVIINKVVLYLKDTEKWKQFTTSCYKSIHGLLLCCISKIQKNESNSQPTAELDKMLQSCVVSQRYRKMKAIHNTGSAITYTAGVVLYLKDTEKWKQFTTWIWDRIWPRKLCCISKIQKNESNSQRVILMDMVWNRCVVSQRYRKMKAIHNNF